MHSEFHKRLRMTRLQRRGRTTTHLKDQMSAQGSDHKGFVSQSKMLKIYLQINGQSLKWVMINLEVHSGERTVYIKMRGAFLFQRRICFAATDLAFKKET